jgi:hypothetical protein
VLMPEFTLPIKHIMGNQSNSTNESERRCCPLTASNGVPRRREPNGGRLKSLSLANRVAKESGIWPQIKGTRNQRHRRYFDKTSYSSSVTSCTQGSLYRRSSYAYSQKLSSVDSRSMFPLVARQKSRTSRV